MRPCRTDGRCQRAIDLGAEPGGFCAAGNCLSEPCSLKLKMNCPNMQAQDGGTSYDCEVCGAHIESKVLDPPPLWFDDGGRSWWGADELTVDALIAWRGAAVAAEQEWCAKLCDALYIRYAATGFPREASAARALAELIRGHTSSMQTQDETK